MGSAYSARGRRRRKGGSMANKQVQINAIGTSYEEPFQGVH